MKSPIYYFAIVIITIFASGHAKAQDEGFIYGKVYTEDRRVYEGPIRWGKEEVYWTDMFNAAKEKNENLRHLSDGEREELDDKHISWFSWDDRTSNWFGSKYWTGHSDDENYIHQFSCQFGEIKAIRPTGRKYVEIELQNGIKHDVSGEGYNDVGLDVRIIDPELGEVDVAWARIEKIEFLNTPGKLTSGFGQPLYGTVEAFGEKFTGLIQWDHDERVTTDKLDGDSDDGAMSVEFGKIRSIERKGGRSLVILKSGREIFLDGSNDVSSGHRGVIVMNKEFPSIDVPWGEFEKIVFEDKSPGPIATYTDFKSQKELSGKVTTHDGKSFSGKLVYDLDEIYDFELLQGKDGEFEFATPFRNIRKITTKGEHRCAIELRNGRRITLDEGQDVNERNQGMLVFASDKTDPTYIPWDEVNEIEFR